MNVWKLTAASTLVKRNEEPSPVEGARRVRVTRIYVNREDAELYSGKKRVKYPFIPGRFAVGLIADDGGSPAFPKGSRVLLHSFLPAEERGTETRTFTEDDFRICGQTTDGFFRDFVYVREDEMTLLPDSVNDEKALLLYHVALAQATVDALDVRRGEHIAVIGGNLLGLFTARLLIYRQASPILVDSRRERLDFARTRGVYYTSLNDGALMGMLGTVTGGRLADGVVFIPSANGIDVNLAVDVCAPGKHVAVAGLSGEGLSVDLGGVVKKQLTLHGVADGTQGIKSAVNLIANKAIDLSGFKFGYTPADKLGALMNRLLEKPLPVNEINVVNLI